MKNNRHFFAAAAIQGMANTFIDADDLAKRAWDIADAMVRHMPEESLEKIPNIFESTNKNEAEGEKKLGEFSKKEPSHQVKSKKSAQKHSLNGVEKVLPLLAEQGKSITQLCEEYEKEYVYPLHYNSMYGNLRRLKKAGRAKSEKAGREHVWSLVAEQPVPIKLSPEVVPEKKGNDTSIIKAKIQADEDDPALAKKIDFAKSLGFVSLHDAIAKVGPFEFAEQFDQWKPDSLIPA